MYEIISFHLQLKHLPVNYFPQPKWICQKEEEKKKIQHSLDEGIMHFKLFVTL